MGPANWSKPSSSAPSWVKDLVIYEIAPRGFTSPAGAGPGGMGSGTFQSLAERVPYLEALGVTAVWLAGYCDANAHFFSIWSVYATERPDSIDPIVGTAADLKMLVAKFHNAGIKVDGPTCSHASSRDDIYAVMMCCVLSTKAKREYHLCFFAYLTRRPWPFAAQVFLDVVTHGVTFAAGDPSNRSKSGSNPFLAAHPEYVFSSISFLLCYSLYFVSYF